MKNYWTLIFAFIFIAGLLFAVSPLFGSSYIPTHDGEYHIIRIAEFAKMIRAGYLVPRWAPDLNSGYGIPIFNYHYPLPNYVGSLVRLFTNDAVYAFQIALGVGYVALSAGAFFWLRSIFGVNPALVGATVASFIPYLFVDMYVRGSIGEVWALALLFWGLRFIEARRYALFALVYGLLILSHNILGMLFTLFLAGYCFIRDKKALPWFLAGIGLAAYFWLPALVESRFVVGLNTVNFREHFVEGYELLIPSWGTEFSGVGSLGNKISFQIGLAPLLVFIGALFVQRREKNTVLSYFLIVMVLCIVFTLPVSLLLWEFVKPLQLIQYPWRLLSFVIPISAYAASFWVRNMKQQWMGLCVCIFAIAVSYSYARPVLYAPRDEAYYTSRQNFTDGTSSMGNSFSTIWSPWKTKRSALDAEILVGDGAVEIVQKKFIETRLSVTAHTPVVLRFNTLYFPGWTVREAGTPLVIDYETDGVIDVSLEEGDHQLTVRFEETPIRTAADLISIASLLWLIGSIILSISYANRNKYHSHDRRPQPPRDRTVHQRTHLRTRGV